MKIKWTCVHLESIPKALRKTKLLTLLLWTSACLHGSFVWSSGNALSWADLHDQGHFNDSMKWEMFLLWFEVDCNGFGCNSHGKMFLIWMKYSRSLVTWGIWLPNSSRWCWCTTEKQPSLHRLVFLVIPTTYIECSMYVYLVGLKCLSGIWFLEQFYDDIIIFLQLQINCLLQYALCSCCLRGSSCQLWKFPVLWLWQGNNEIKNDPIKTRHYRWQARVIPWALSAVWEALLLIPSKQY